MSGADGVPEHATTADNDVRVAQAAADLGVEVPDGFFLTGVDDAGQHTAFMPGNASALRISTAILRRLDGHSVADSFAPPEEEPGPQPEWMPPEDPDDTEAWEAWMAERARHPEWPAFCNGPTDWIPLVATSTGRRMLTTLWRGDQSRSLSDLPVEPFEHTLDRFDQQGDVSRVREVLLDEERRFDVRFRRGRHVLSGLRTRGPLSDEQYDYLHDTHGLPRELVVGLLTD